MLEPQALSRGTKNQRDDLGHILPQQLWVRTALGLQRCLGAGSRVRRAGQWHVWGQGGQKHQRGSLRSWALSLHITYMQSHTYHTHARTYVTRITPISRGAHVQTW